MATTTLFTINILAMLLISFSPFPSLSDKCNDDDKKALFAIYAHFNITGSLNYRATVCCNWEGVTCDPVTGRVTKLLFRSNTLIGTIPDAIANLSQLQILDLSGQPNLVGSIPSSLTKLAKLTELKLGFNSLSGPIPSFLSQIHSLTDLDLASNKFSGSIPPSLSNLPNLFFLRLGGNRLTGPIPEPFGSPASSLRHLYLSGNKLSGPIPSSLGMHQWTGIDLSYNQLTGDASVIFGPENATILDIDVSRNRFEFNLTGVRFANKLKFLDMGHNKIYGEIPAQINNVTNLVQFNVSYNRLCGEIPAGKITSLFDEYTYSHNKCLCGAPLQTPCKK